MKRKNHNRLKLRFDRLLSKSLIRQFAILGIVLCCLFLLSWLFLHISGCNWKDFAKKSNVSEFLLPLYLLIDTNAFNNLYINGVHGWALFVSSITFVIGAFIFNGAIISIMTNAIEQRVNDYKKGKIHYLKSGHYVIMGYDDMVPSIIGDIFEKDKDAYVLLLTAAKIPLVRERLKKTFTEQQLEHVIINYGHRMSTEYYKDIHLESADEIFVVGLRSLAAHDAINVECVDSICRYLKPFKERQLPRRITCVFEDLDTYGAFKTSEIFQEVRDLDIEFVPYNFYAGWAKQVFIKRCHKDKDDPIQHEIKYPAVYGCGITPNDAKYVHLVFIGTTNFAVAFAMEAAHVLHFPNFNKGNRYPRTRVTFIDLNADKEKDVFIARNRHLFEIQSYSYQDLSNVAKPMTSEIMPPSFFNKENGYDDKDRDFLDVEFEFIKGDIFSKNVQDVISKWATEHNVTQYLSIFIALADQRSNFAFGMNMPDAVYDNEIPVFIRQDRSDNFVTNLRVTDEKIIEKKNLSTYSYIDESGLKQITRKGRYANIYPFGMNEASFSADEVSLKRAKLINFLYATANYDTYKFKGILALDAVSANKIWTEANEHWKTLTVALKWSNLYSAYTIRTKLATLRAMRGLSVDDTSKDTTLLSDYEVEELARVEHNRWNVEKLLMGFRKARRGEDKYAHPEFEAELQGNKKRFIHHDIRPFDELGPIKELDYEFSRYIPWIMKMTE